MAAQQGAWQYRASKFVRRHRAGVAVAASLVVLLIGFIVAMAWQMQETARQRDRAQAEAAKAAQVSSFLVGLFETSNPGEIQGDTLTAPQLLARGTERIERLKTHSSVQAEMLGAIGRAQQDLGRYDTAQALLRRSLCLRRKTQGPEHPAVAKSLHHLADAFAEERDFEPAVPLYREALGIRRQALGKEHLKTAGTMSALAGVLRNMGKPDSAVVLARRALAIHRRHHDSDHPGVISAEHMLAYVLRAAGEYDEGAALYRKVLDKERAHYGPDHSKLAETHNDFAFLLMKQEHYAAAERHYRKALDIYRSVYGPVHPRTLTIGKNLAGTLMRHEKYAEVENALRENLKALREHAPEDSARLAGALADLAQFHAERGHVAKALKPMRDRYRIDRERLGERNLYAICQGGKLGALLKALGRDLEAHSLLQQTYTYLQAKRDTILQHRDSYVRLDTASSLRFMIKIFEQNDLPGLARRYRALLQRYLSKSEA